MTHKQKKSIGYFEFWDRSGLTLDGEQEEVFVSALSSLRRLAPKLHRQCENECNGVGWVRGTKYYAGNIDGYVVREHGSFVKSAYTLESDYQTGENVFSREIDRIEGKIKDLVEFFPQTTNIEIQHDPRGWEVKMTINGVDASGLIYN